MLCELEPASGSVMANAMMIEPSAIPGSQRCFCSSVPKRAMIVPLMAGETTIISSGAAGRRELLASTIDSSYMPAPPPPYSSGRFTPMKPSLPASCHSSVGGSPRGPSRCSRARSVAPSSATALRSACCSSVSVKVHSCSSVGLAVTTARTAPTSTCWPSTWQFGDHAVGRGVDRCCIFMASSHSIGWPCVTRSPTWTADPCTGARHRGDQRARRDLGAGVGEPVHYAESDPTLCGVDLRPTIRSAPPSKARRTPWSSRTTRVGRLDQTDPVVRIGDQAVRVRR